jgi:anti-sigma regulatory factor (Ser/Thr protein kinase)
MCSLVLFINHLPPEALPVRLMLPGWPPNGALTSTKPSEQSVLEKTPNGPVSYLTRMGFWDLVRDRLDCKDSQVPVWPSYLPERKVLLDLTVMHSHDAINVMLRKTGELLQGIGYSVMGRAHVLEVLSELCSNVLLHAQAELGGIAAMQTYRNRQDVRYLVIGIGDMGIGVRRSLAANDKLAGRLESDAQALGVAAQAGASRFASGGHGGGLPRVLDIARRYSGRVAMRSGTGALAYNGTDEQRRSFDTANLPGTHLRIVLPESKLRGKP